MSDKSDLERKLVRLAAVAAVREGARPVPRASDETGLAAFLDEIDAVVLPRTLRFDAGAAPLFCEVASRRLLRVYLGEKRPVNPLDVSDESAAEGVRAIFERFLKGAGEVLVTSSELSEAGIGAEIGISADAMRLAWDLPARGQEDPAAALRALAEAHGDRLASWHLTGPEGDASGGNADDSTALGLLSQRAEKELMDAPGPYSAAGDPATLVMLTALQGHQTLLAGRLGPARLMMRAVDDEAALAVVADWQARILL